MSSCYLQLQKVTGSELHLVTQAYGYTGVYMVIGYSELLAVTVKYFLIKLRHIALLNVTRLHT